MTSSIYDDPYGYGYWRHHRHWHHWHADDDDQAEGLLRSGPTEDPPISRRVFLLSNRKLLGKQLAGAKAFAASPDECRYAMRISHGGREKCGLEIGPAARAYRNVTVSGCSLREVLQEFLHSLNKRRELIGILLRKRIVNI